MNRALPIGLFIVFFALIAGATLYYAPSWGLMDDSQHLYMVERCQESTNFFKAVVVELAGSEIPRPFYIVWAEVFYRIFYNWPTGFYIFIASWNMLAMIFWGHAFYRIFCVRREDYFWAAFFFPLTFFIFLPFWNIFNYLSLQEKFIVFFAPLAIYFFQKLYRNFSWLNLIILYAIVMCGLCSKATFIHIPLIFLAYALLDLTLFRYRPKLSWMFLVINSIVFALYAIFTFTVQLKTSYAAKYKTNLGIAALAGKFLLLPIVVKLMTVIGLVGIVSTVVYVIRKRRPEFSLSVLIYLGLLTYSCLLLPWGSQSYLLSAMGPLVMGALFPIYLWFHQKGGVVKLSLNFIIFILLCAVFVGNIIPNISHAGDVGKVVAFVRSYPNTIEDIYFMPPPYSESAYAMGNLTGKHVIFCADGQLSAEKLSNQGANYVLFNDLFSSLHVSGVKMGKEVYSNHTWRVYELVLDGGNDEMLSVPFEKNMVQRLKAGILSIR